MLDALKLKETFPNFSNKKINIVQKVINSPTEKSKPKISMTTKGPSQKQVIVPTNNELSKRFIKDFFNHVININHTLKSICSNTITDFIYTSNKDIIIITNNVLSSSDLQEIKKYIKNSLPSDMDSIFSPRLP